MIKNFHLTKSIYQLNNTIYNTALSTIGFRDIDEVINLGGIRINDLKQAEKKNIN